MKFSIIIPAYNVAEFLTACLQSVLDQDYQDYEIILINDGSTDETDSICKTYADQNPQIRYFYSHNSGPSAPRNLGVKKAKGEYILFLDSDDTFVPGALKLLAEHLVDQSDLLRFQAQEFFENGEIVPHPELGFSACSSKEAIARIVSYYYVETVWVYCYRTKFFKSHNFQYAPNRLSEDFGLTPLILAKAKTIKSIPDVCYNYRQRTGSIMHSSAKRVSRMTDAFAQLETLVPALAPIEGTGPLLNYLVASILTTSAHFSKKEFDDFYHKAKSLGYLIYLQPTSLKNYPRIFLLRRLPNLFRALVKLRLF